MKKLTTLILTLAAVQMSFAQLLVEDFNFTGAVISVNGWNPTASPTATPAISTTTGLTYAGFDGNGIGNAVSLAPSGEDLTKNLSAAQTSGTIYMTFMVNVSATTSANGGYITGLTSGTTAFLTNYNLRVFVKASGAGFDFGVSRTNGTPVAFTGNTYNFNQTYLVTCKYVIGTSAAFDDVASLYVHPATPALTEPATMSATFTGTTGADVISAGIAAIFIRQGATAESVTAVVDGFRVSNTWIQTIPVELVKFAAQKDKSAAKLTWTTATELNNAFYAIERSTDGKDFDKIGEVSGYGNSQQMRNYTFMDEKPSGSVNYYRLRQVDFNGKETVSKTVSVNFDKNASIKVYPAIATDKINVEINSDGAADLTIVNLAGQVVKTQKVENTEGVLPINISDLPNGSYIIRMVSKTGEMTKRFEKQ